MTGPDRASTLLEAAVEYVKRGWAITPLHWVTEAGVCSCGNPRNDPNHDRKQGGKHPIQPRWQLNPLSTRSAVEKQWASTPLANIGGLTGVPSGLWALDMDPDNGARESDVPGAMHAARIHRTGSGGFHYIYRGDDEFMPTNARGSLPDGWDVRGTGGQIVLPPSVSCKGAYTVVRGLRPTLAPELIGALIRTRKSDGEKRTVGCDFCPVRALRETVGCRIVDGVCEIDGLRYAGCGR